MHSFPEYSPNPEEDRGVNNIEQGRYQRIRKFISRMVDIFQPEPKITTNYESLGDTSIFLPKYLQQIKDAQTRELIHGKYHLTFYLNSSDSLTSLTKLDQRGKRIMTVSGSGEFAHAFIQNGAHEIYSFDISPAEAFNAELRHKALCNLNMSEYIKLFSNWVADYNDQPHHLPIYDEVILQKIMPMLSSQAKHYFTLLLSEPDLCTLNPGTYMKGFARARRNGKNSYNRFIGDVITSEVDYRKLQKKALRVRFNQLICDAQNMGGEMMSIRPDQIYQSNIGYRFDQIIRNAYKNAKMGAEIVCSVDGESDVFRKDERGCYYYEQRKLNVGDEIIYSLAMHESMDIKVPIKIIGIDTSAKFGITIAICN